MEGIKIHCIGSPEIVGKAAFLLEYENHKLILDYGVELSRPPKFPITVPPNEVDAVIITHAHLDHIGATPYLYVSGNMPLYTTKPTMDLADLLIRDFLKLSGEFLPFEYIDFLFMKQKSIYLDYRVPLKLNKTPFEIEFLDAGHIPGSAQVIIRAGKHRILYTGDINTYETRLQRSADLRYEDDFDIVIIESTYGADKHPKRRRLEEVFVEKVSEVIENDGIALIPAFAVGRSQEILLILYCRNFKHKIVMDGMALEATRILLGNPMYIKSPKRLRKAFQKVKKVKRWRERKRVLKEPAAIIAPAGMLGGGAAVYYISKLHKDPKNAIFLVGYQAPGSPGRVLLEEGVVMIDKSREKSEAPTYYFEFSSHTDQDGLRKILRKIPGDPLIVIVHGEERGRKALAEIAEDYGFRVSLPYSGSKIELR